MAGPMWAAVPTNHGFFGFQEGGKQHVGDVIHEEPQPVRDRDEQTYLAEKVGIYFVGYGGKKGK